MIVQYKLIIAFVVVVLVFMVVIPDDQMYEHENSTLIFQSNGNYRVEQDDAFGGTYHRYGNTIELYIPFGTLKMVDYGDYLTDEDGDEWVKV